MPEIKLAKQKTFDWSDEEKDKVRELLFEKIDGADDASKRNWRKLWNLFSLAELGEVFTIDIFFHRNPRFHRLHFAMEQRIFKSQERFPSYAFDNFRNWAKVGFQFVDWYKGPHGQPLCIPRSIAFNKIDESAMQDFHKKWVEFIRSPYAAKFLWPHAPDSMRLGIVDSLLDEFETNQ